MLHNLIYMPITLDVKVEEKLHLVGTRTKKGWIPLYYITYQLFSAKLKLPQTAVYVLHSVHTDSGLSSDVYTYIPPSSIMATEHKERLGNARLDVQLFRD